MISLRNDRCHCRLTSAHSVRPGESQVRFALFVLLYLPPSRVRLVLTIVVRLLKLLQECDPAYSRRQSHKSRQHKALPMNTWDGSLWESFGGEMECTPSYRKRIWQPTTKSRA